MSSTISPPKSQILEEMTGFVAQDEEHPPGPREAVQRPMSLAWVSDDLLANTIDVWSEAYGRPISRDEALEILMNVKRLGEVLLRARREMSRK